MNTVSNSVVAKALRLVHELRYALYAGKVRVERFDMDTLPQAARFFDEHGWVLVKGVFTPSEVEHFRAAVRTSEREGACGDLLSNPRLSPVLLDDRIIHIARTLLGAQPTYYGDSSWYSSNTHPFALGFHKDNADKFNQNGPDWYGKYPILRIGIYLQDHVEHSGGVALRDGSHHTTDCTVGQPFAVPTAKGDVVVWSFRTSHSGFVSRLRLFPTVFLPLTLQKLLVVRKRGSPNGTFRPASLLFRPKEYPDRLALFIAFGIDGKHLRRYVEYLKTRRFAVVLWQQSLYTDAMRTAVNGKGLLFLDAPDQVKDIDPTTVSEEHHDPPADP